MTIRMSGPAAALLALAAPLAAQDAAPEFVVHVNEPFLTFETARGTVRVTAPGDPEGTVVPAERLEAAGVVQVVGDHQGERFVVTIIEEACEDDMAGMPYSRTATVSWGDALKAGCARLSTEPQPSEGD